MDDTALRFEMFDFGHGCFGRKMPNLIKALKKAAGSRVDSRLSADAQMTLAGLAMVKEGLGDSLAIMKKLLLPPGNKRRKC